MSILCVYSFVCATLLATSATRAESNCAFKWKKRENSEIIVSFTLENKGSAPCVPDSVQVSALIIVFSITWQDFLQYWTFFHAGYTVPCVREGLVQLRCFTFWRMRSTLACVCICWRVAMLDLFWGYIDLFHVECFTSIVTFSFVVVSRTFVRHIICINCFKVS